MSDERAFDADNHYYEALDAFTRHLDPTLGPRVIQWAEIDGRKYHVLGGRVSRAVTSTKAQKIKFRKKNRNAAKAADV